MVYEHPLAYLLGLEGFALLRSFTGDFDRDFVDARLAEVRGLLDDPRLTGAAVEVARVPTAEGYRIWAPDYDGPNAAFTLDEPVVGRILDGLPPGVALDAACGTGRVAASLAGRGHRVVGVDSSADMLSRARERVPDGRFLAGELCRLPVGDATADLVVCSLALVHLPSLGPVMAEFARVLRPGGHLVVSDMHPESIARGHVPVVLLDGGRPGRIASHRHPVGDQLRAALAAGFQVRAFEELEYPAGPAGEPAEEVGPWHTRPWCLAALVPEAAAAAADGVPSVLVWHFQAA